MAARLDSVARFICEAGDWNVTNLQLQKIMYLAQMLYMGEHAGERLVDTYFEAWDYGPVSPPLYRKVRGFGAGPIEDVFPDALPFKKGGATESFLRGTCNDLLQMK